MLPIRYLYRQNHLRGFAIPDSKRSILPEIETALFLAFAKRRDDVVIRQETGKITRKNIVRYNLEFLNQTLSIIGAITIVCYIIYTVSPEVEARMNSQYVYITSIFVLAGILRYLQITIVDIHSGSPTKIMLHDRFIQICLFLWACLFAFIIYL